MPHIRFNWVDVVFVILLVRIGYIGFKNGFFPEFFRLLGLLIASIFSFNYYIKGFEVISFLSIFLSILFVFKLLAVGARLIFGGGAGHLSIGRRISGLILSFGRGITLVTLIYTLFINSPFEYLSSSARERSFSGQYISRIETLVMELLERGSE